MTNEAFARVKIDALLAAQGWDVLDTSAVRFEVQLPDGTRADYVLCDRHGRSLAVIEAKRYSVNPGDAAAQAKAYAQQLGVRYAFLCNGNEVLFWEWQREAYARPVKTIFKQDDLERRIATLTVRRDPASVAIDRRIVERDYQIECIDTLCRDIGMGRRKLLVEMATGTGKTRTAAGWGSKLRTPTYSAWSSTSKRTSVAWVGAAVMAGAASVAAVAAAGPCACVCKGAQNRHRSSARSSKEGRQGDIVARDGAA
jgi:type I restriction enzyme R subunit